MQYATQITSNTHKSTKSQRVFVCVRERVCECVYVCVCESVCERESVCVYI